MKSRKRKGMSPLESIGAIIIIIVFVLIVTGKGKALYGYFFDTTKTISSCEGMGLTNGKCVEPSQAGNCQVSFKGLGCKGTKSMCCFGAEGGESGGGGGGTGGTGSGNLEFSGKLEAGDKKLNELMSWGNTEYVDVYSFDGQKDQKVTILAEASGFNSFLYLWNPAQKVIETKSGNPNAQIQITLTEAGKYEVYVTSRNEGDIGSYTLKINFENAIASN